MIVYVVMNAGDIFNDYRTVIVITSTVLSSSFIVLRSFSESFYSLSSNASIAAAAIDFVTVLFYTSLSVRINA